MRTTRRAEFWVMYERTVKVQKKQIVSNAVCEQAEWEAMERAEPGANTLVRERIGSRRRRRNSPGGRPVERRLELLSADN